LAENTKHKKLSPLGNQRAAPVKGATGMAGCGGGRGEGKGTKTRKKKKGGGGPPMMGPAGTPQREKNFG